MVISTITRVYLFGLGSFFLFLFVQMVSQGPVEALKPHGLEVGSQPRSGLAELRAYYGGTQIVLAVIFFLGSRAKAMEKRRKSLAVSIFLLGMFVLIRVWCYFVDGPPRHGHAHLIWALEAAGTVFGSVLYMFDRECESSANGHSKRS